MDGRGLRSNKRVSTTGVCGNWMKCRVFVRRTDWDVPALMSGGNNFTYESRVVHAPEDRKVDQKEVRMQVNETETGTVVDGTEK